MQQIKKIQAFTLSEMLVVLLLTSIVVGMGFAVMKLVQQQMHGIGNNYKNHSELNLLRQSLWIDFNQSDGIWYDANHGTLLCANEIRETTYYIQEDNIIKDVDTFQVALDKKVFFFNGELQISGEIDAMDLITAKENGGQRLFVFKRNAATSYINE